MRKEKIFNRISNSLAKIADCEFGKFICPICLNTFSKEGIKSGVLSVEHVPPKSIGHNIITILCKSCNQICGHSIDSERYKLEKLKIKSSLSDPIRVKITNEEGTSVNCNMVFSDGKIKVLDLPKNNNPIDHKNWENTFEKLTKDQAWNGYNFNFTTVEEINFRKARISDLKSAYLYMFVKLGYRYILNANLNPVRYQILNSDKKIIENFSLTANKNPIISPDFLISQDPINAICVKIDDETIILPDKNSSIDFYEHLMNSRPTELKGIMLPLPIDHEMILDSL